MGILRSENIDQLAKALAVAQGQMAVPQKKRTAEVQMKVEKGGGKYTYSYADLSDIREAITPALSKNGLMITQPIDADEVRMTTLLIHESGQYLGSTYDLPRGLSAQSFGSALTYARRYSLCALLGVVAEDDDDAGRSKAQDERNARQARRTPPPTPTSGGLGPKIAPRGSQGPMAGGTSGLPLPVCPPGVTKEDLKAKLRQVSMVFCTMDPQADIGTMIMTRYGAKSANEMTMDEAYDFHQFLTAHVAKGVQV